MNALLTLCFLILLPLSTGYGFDFRFKNSLTAGTNLLFLHTVRSDTDSEFGSGSVAPKDERFVVPYLMIGYGFHTPWINVARHVTIGLDMNIRIASSLSQVENDGSYFMFGSAIAVVARTGAGSGQQSKGFGYGGGLGMQTGIESVPKFSDYGMPIRPQLIGEISYAVSRRNWITLQLYCDITAVKEGTSGGTTSARQAGLLLRYMY